MTIHHIDCMEFMRSRSKFADFTITDIPYDEVNRSSNGLRNLDKGSADIATFELVPFLRLVVQSTKNSIIIFTGANLFSETYNFFVNECTGTVRPIVYAKTNPSPMNGKRNYLSGAELGVYFKFKGAPFYAHCKSNVFNFPCGKSKIHPTEKNHKLIESLILDNTKELDVVFDPCAGSGSHLLGASKLNRNYEGCELNEKWYNVAKERLQNGTR